MRRILRGAVAAVACAVALAASTESMAAPKPTVVSIIEGRDSSTNGVVLLVVGKSLTKFTSFALRGTGGADAGPVTLLSKSATMLALRLAPTVVLGEYDLALTYSKTKEDVVHVAISAGSVPPGSLTGAAIGGALRADIDDAATLGGRSSADFALVSLVVARSGGAMTGPLTVAPSTGTAVDGSTAASGGIGIYGHATASAGSGEGVRGETFAATGRGVFGWARGTTGATSGVAGECASGSSGAAGVAGFASSTTGPTAGVSGVSASNSGVGVGGSASSPVGGTVGVLGGAASTSGTGVYGLATASSGTTYGVRGEVASPDGTGVHGSATSATGVTTGVFGSASSPDGSGVTGFATASSGSSTGVWGQCASNVGVGVYGQATSSSGVSAGVLGASASASGRGVQGSATSTTGLAWGVYGTTASSAGYGVYGYAVGTTGLGSGVVGRTDSNTDAAAGVEGRATSTTGRVVGVYGQSDGSGGYGVTGNATSTTGGSTGVYGVSAASSGNGVLGIATSATGAAWGVWGTSASSSGVGVVASATGSGSGTSALVANHSGSVGNVAVFQSGGINAARIDKSGRGYFNGGTATSGADFAESVATREPVAELAPGDVIAIDPTGVRRFSLCRDADSALVAGIFSTRPGVLARPGEVASLDDQMKDEIPLAVTGIVPCKVCDEGGPIRAGDLLVSASIPGYAKRAPANPAPGTILAKSLGALAAGVGRVEVLITMR